MSRLLTRLRASLADLSPVLSRVAEYVLEHPDAVLYHSVTELAEATRSSEGSIIRFCQDLGFSGFQEFKLTLAIESGSLPRNGAEPVAANNTNLMNELVDHAATSLSETGLLYEQDSFEHVAERMISAGRVDIYGVGASGVIAEYFAYKLIRLGFTAQSYTDMHLASMSASNLSATDVAIAISSSGSTLDTLQALKIAKKSGAFTVAVTNRLKSPLAKVASRSLFASPPESPLTGGDVFAKIGQLLVLEALTRLMVTRDERLQEHVRRTAQVVAERSM
ncbi:MAG TPA: MurR/RpiR family transcriptional regulator [Trueperaceae bacterium]